MDMVKVELVEGTGDEWGRNYALNSKKERILTSYTQLYQLSPEKDDLSNSLAIVSFEAKHGEDSPSIVPHVYYRTPDGKNIGFSYGAHQSTTAEYQRFVIPIDEDKIPNDMSDYVTLIIRKKDNTSSLYIRKVKLERGSQATDWTPAPEDYANYDYKNKECEIELGLTLPDESIEYVSMGKYTVENAVRKNNTITLDCVDRMYKAEKEYVSDLMYPTTILEILQSACDQAGIELATTTFANSDYIVPNEPVFESITCRKVFAQVAELAGGYAKINRLGQLEILTLGVEPVRDINDFKFTINEVAEASIDKVIVKVGEETATKGTGDNIYTIVDNMFVQNPNNVIDAVYDVLKDVNYIAYHLPRWQGDFSLDSGDKVTIDGNDTYVLSRKLTYTGGLREDYTAPAKSNVEKESTGKGSLTLDIENVKTQIKVLDGEITQTIERVENLVVGANNRLYDSQTEISFGFNVGTGTIQIFRDQRHPYYKVTSEQNVDLFAAFPDSQFAEPLAELGEVTISLDVLVDVDRTVTIDGKEFNVKANRWTRIHVTKILEENTTKRLRVRNPFSRKRTRDISIGTKLIDSLSVNINTLYYRNLKVERGNVATDWTLTPEELEENVNRYKSEIKQLDNLISMSVSAIENNVSAIGNNVSELEDDVEGLSSRMSSAELKITPEAIVQSINTTDGVGRVKTVNVTVDERGLEIENGALIVRDANNAAILTSDGLKMKYVFVSSGEMNGWSFAGTQLDIDGWINPETILFVYLPDEFLIESATLYTKAMPVRLEYDPHGAPDGLYQVKDLNLYKVINDRDVHVFMYDGYMYPTLVTGSKTNISSAVWGGAWTPTGSTVQIKAADVKDVLNVGGRTVLTLRSLIAGSEANARYASAIQMELEITGFLRG